MIEFVMLLLALVCAVAEGPKAYSNLRIAWKSVRRKRERINCRQTPREKHSNGNPGESRGFFLELAA
jgi:hypothetical protein